MALPKITTPVTELFKIQHPVMLAGMNVAAGPELGAAVTNAGGLGVIGGVFYTPKMLRLKIEELKEELQDKNAPFGVDLLLPQVGGNARATNKDYTGGELPELIDIIIESKASLFVSAVGVPPKFVVDKLHAAGIPVMNMIGSPNHVSKALDAGVDIICAQGGEGGGHTGEVATSILIPMVVDLCRGKMSPLTGKQVPVVAAGGIYDGRGLAMALSLGADGVWVGTRFVASEEGGAPPKHKNAIVKASAHDTHRCEAFTGRPMRIIKTPYSTKWTDERATEMRSLMKAGILPGESDMEKFSKATDEEKKTFLQSVGGEMPSASNIHLSGQVAGAISEILPAKRIIEEMVRGACDLLQVNIAKVSWPSTQSRL
jgi:NAD(P)H-dependent flavin oxidoreductase YrpB (nitropropane dioxygenase family)